MTLTVGQWASYQNNAMTLPRPFLSLSLAALLTACSPSPAPSSFTAIDQQGVYALIHGKDQIEGQLYEDMTRTAYAMPTTRWVLDVYAPQLYDYLLAHGELAYERDWNDCVKYTAHAVSAAYTAYGADKGRLAGLSLAVGHFTFVPIQNGSVGKAHVIVMFVVNDQDGNGPKLFFFEPQTRQEYPMAWEEAISCQNLRM